MQRNLPPRRFEAGRGRVVGGDSVRQLVASYRKSDMGAVVDDFKLRPGFIYTQVRAISARVNQNYDAWPSGELKKYYRTFLGKPIFVNHQNEDPTKARGRVVAARYIEKGADKYIEVIQEVDAQRFPKLAKEIREGGMDSVSMGVEAGFTICSVCENRATDIFDMCNHIKLHKGEYLPHHKTGKKTLVYENCYKLGFFELSYVFDPADETAVVSRVIAAGKRQATPTDDYFQWKAEHGEEADQEHDKPRRSLPSRELEQWSQRTKKRMGREVPQEKYQLSDKDTRLVWSPKSNAYQDHQPPKEIVRRKDPSATQIYDNASPEEQRYLDPLGYMEQYHPSKERYQVPEHLRPEHRTSATETEQRPEETLPEQRPLTRKKRRKRRYRSQEGDDLLKNAPWYTYASRQRTAYGETEAPEDIDTLREESEDDTDEWHSFVKTIPELREPNMDKTQQLDREQEEDGLDVDRRSEDVEDIRPEDDQTMPVNPPATKKGRHTSNRGVPMSRNRGARRRYAEEGFPPEQGGGDEAALIAQAEAELAQAEEEALGGGDYGDEGGYSDEGGYEDEFGGDEGYPEDDYGDEGDGDEDDFGGEPDGDYDDEGYPEEEGDEYAPEDEYQDEGEEPPFEEHEARRRTVRRRASRRNMRGAQKGTRMGSLADRGRYARTANRRYADDSGHTDGGPYGVDDSQGAQEEIFLSDVPSAEAVVLPEAGDSVPNTSDHVAGRSDFDPRHYQRLADVVSALPIEARKAMADRVVRMFQADNRAFNPRTFYVAARVPVGIVAGRYIFAEELVDPDVVNPELSGTDSQELKGDDFESLALENVETQPKDASRHYFAEFDRWLAKTTGRTARQHGNANFIRRQAARYVKESGRPLAALFPALDYVLAEARSNERSAMRRHAEDTSLEVAAPGGRADVEAPVKNVTDADAQASQFDLGDFGNNAGDDLADPNLDTDSQIWAPDKAKESKKLASAVAAVRCARAHIEAGLAPKEDEWKLVARFETLRHATVVDRTRLLEAVIQANKAKTARKVTAASSRGTGRGIPMGLGSGRRTAGVQKAAANDPDTDSLMFF